MKKTNSVLLLSTCLFLLSNCKKPDDPQSPVSKLPVVTIDSVTDITLTTADINANAEFDAGFAITARGICYATTANPTTANSKISAGTGTGIFKVKLTGMVKGTTYYVRAFATNSEGTSYSAQQTVRAGTVKDIDGNEYDLVTIGGNTWMAGNLRVTKYNNGDPIPMVSNNTDWKNLSTGAYCNVNNSASNTNEYGLLYNWHAAFDSRGICPNGYRMVTQGNYAGIAPGSGTVGGDMKTTGTTYWKSPNYGATNNLGFSGKGTGYRDSGGIYQEFQESSYFWDREYVLAPKTAYVAYLVYDDDEFSASSWTRGKRYGLCIRCLKK